MVVQPHFEVSYLMPCSHLQHEVKVIIGVKCVYIVVVAAGVRM